MASLTHVCIWRENGWERITAEKACEIIPPNSTVSANSGLFMCELCGQYVTLTKKGNNVRHFRHQSGEKSKNCPERLFGSSLKYINLNEYQLPIRIKVSNQHFSFELGLVRAPIEDFDDFRIIIEPIGYNRGSSYEYAKERLNPESITYLSIGDNPTKAYKLSLPEGLDELYKYWPPEIKGMDDEGTIFDKQSGRMLSFDADVEVNTNYYLLKRGSSIGAVPGLKIEKIAIQGMWSLYCVCATVFDENTAKFFLEYHCRLTEQPISLQPIWPLFVEGEYLIKHNEGHTFFWVKGRHVEMDTFPQLPIRKYRSQNTSQGIVYDVECSEKKVLISAGRIKAIKYTYFWKENIEPKISSPRLRVTNILDEVVEPGVSHILPKDGTLCFLSQYDGEVIIYDKGSVVTKYRVQADKKFEINNIIWGKSIQLNVGLDCFWKITYKKAEIDKDVEDEERLLQYISSGNRKMIAAPHSLANIARGFHRYPKIMRWIRICMKKKVIDEQSYRRLQCMYIKCLSKESRLMEREHE